MSCVCCCGNLISGMSPEEKLIVYKKIGDKSRGHVTPDYVKKKISDGGKGKKRSSETRNNIREASGLIIPTIPHIRLG